MVLNGKKIVIGITGSIAAYKIPFLVRLLIKEGAEVRVIMTPMSKEFVTPLTLATLSQQPVIFESFKHGSGEWNNHVDLGQWADAMIFAPVTANTLGKMAHGIADNFLVTAYLSAKCPVFIAPAMDLDMFAHPSTQNNLSILKSFGNIIIEPQVGELASGLSGPGRLEEPEVILQVIRNHFTQHLDLYKKKVLITAGPTYENIDPVRFIGNYSTGGMGFALAFEAAKRGANVTLITGPSHLQTNNALIDRIDVQSAEEMYNACMLKANDSEIVIMAAAVADYTYPNQSNKKLKKKSAPFVLKLSPTRDILSELGKNKKKNQLMVGFALETDNELINANNKLISKNLDFIVLNSLNEKGAGFGYKTNKITIIGRSGIIFNGTLAPKPVVAAEIFDFILQNRNLQS
jgi:phosphopantothenoylcysteine decarboxylase / phosphopantothenate---cysteine ligase